MFYMLPMDGDKLSLDAVRHLITLVQNGLKARALLANVQDAPHLYEVVLAPDIEVLDRASEGAGQHALQAARDLLDQHGIEWVDDIAHGDPARVLAEMAERHGCDGIIMGSGHTGLLSNSRLGPVAQAVLHHAAIPVTIVRHAAPEDGPDDHPEP
jgi:nucleotide-binding universal stress UspA family protein